MAATTTVQIANRTKGAKASGPSGDSTPRTIVAQHSHVGNAFSASAVTPTETRAHVIPSIANGKFSVSRMLSARTTPVSPLSTA